ncbi:hypothetical protein K2173_008289 [Erythroxylum novogranatense]|uniref:Uncharacterized protein n=1 Tax=Erythroxylum novogranatense TaxID=1862640 RepID=A0AAV8U3G4_9ROSI|nr:hypothetical protein K2173_008289 [Erythroxylum novogranatense]
MKTKNHDQYKKRLWTEEEDQILLEYVRVHGRGRWSRISNITGLKRCGKSCRLRWLNYLSPNVKRGGFSEEEDDLIIRLHNLLGNRWSLIAGRVPGRTDNQVKNHWNTHLCKKLGLKKQVKRAVTSSRRKLSIGNQEISYGLSKNSDFLHEDNNFTMTKDNPFTVAEPSIEGTPLIELLGAESPLFYRDQFSFSGTDLMNSTNGYSPEFVGIIDQCHFRDSVYLDAICPNPN